MNSKRINFFPEGIKYTVKNKGIIRKWIKETIQREGYQKLGDLNFIFCNDEYLLKINQEYLNHDTLTDIITFDSSEFENQISGDIFISIERIRENAKNFKVSEYKELLRVMVHGVLHLCGYLDEEASEKETMTTMENKYLSEFPEEYL